MVWGGGPARSFAGIISLPDGNLEIVRNLSIQTIGAAAVLAMDRTVSHIRTHSPTKFVAPICVSNGKPDSILKFEFREPGDSQTSTLLVSLKQLLNSREQFAIDARGS